MPIYKTDDKKDGLYKYKVRVNYVDLKGQYKQITRTAYGAAEAKQLEARLQKEYATEALKPSSRLTLNELYEEYSETIRHEIRATSANKSLNTLKKFILPDLGNPKISALTVADMQRWKNAVAKKPLSIRTRQNYYKTLNALLNWAVKVDYLQANPLSKLGNFTDKNLELDAKPLQYYTSNEFQYYIHFARDTAKTMTDWGCYVFFAIAYYTGMRKGEINALRWSDIDGNIIHVRRSISQKLKSGDIETPPKNKSSIRDLQAPEPLIIILDEHRARQMKDPRYSPNFRVCGGPDCLRDSTIEHHNITYAEGAHLPHIRIHDFRHSHASLLANAGINIQEIARRLGHSDVAMTWNTYSHLYPREEERALTVLNKIW